MAQRRLFIDKQTCIVWSPVRDDVPHPDDAFAVVGMEAFGRNDARNTAHGRLGLAETPFGALDALTREKMDTAALGHVKQVVKLQQGIPVEKAKDLIKVMKESKIRTQGSIQGDQLRVSGKNRDDLQATIALLRQQQDPMKIDLQFNNFRD